MWGGTKEIVSLCKVIHSESSVGFPEAAPDQTTKSVFSCAGGPLNAVVNGLPAGGRWGGLQENPPPPGPVCEAQGSIQDGGGFVGIVGEQDVHVLKAAAVSEADEESCAARGELIDDLKRRPWSVVQGKHPRRTLRPCR